MDVKITLRGYVDRIFLCVGFSILFIDDFFVPNEIVGLDLLGIFLLFI